MTAADAELLPPGSTLPGGKLVTASMTLGGIPYARVSDGSWEPLGDRQVIPPPSTSSLARICPTCLRPMVTA